MLNIHKEQVRVGTLFFFLTQKKWYAYLIACFKGSSHSKKLALCLCKDESLLFPLNSQGFSVYADNVQLVFKELGFIFLYIWRFWLAAQNKFFYLKRGSQGWLSFFCLKHKREKKQCISEKEAFKTFLFVVCCKSIFAETQE